MNAFKITQRGVTAWRHSAASQRGVTARRHSATSQRSMAKSIILYYQEKLLILEFTAILRYFL